MRKIKLAPDKPFHNSCDIAIVDITDGAEKKRGKITIEYARVDVQQLQRQGMDLDGAMTYFNDAINATVRRYIADEWECVEGWEEVNEIIRSHAAPYYND